jgi:hypothetical protein
MILLRITKAGKIRDCIIVGIWNVPEKRYDYFPQKIIDSIPEPTRFKI